MKKIICFLTALVLAGAASAPADVLIYQFRTVNKAVGECVEFTYSTRGYLVWDLADNHLTWVEYSSPRGTKRYHVTDGTPVVVTVSGLGGRQITTFSGAGGEDGHYFQDFNRGQNATLKHRPGDTFQFPRTFKGLSHSLNTIVGPRLTDNSHTFVYSPTRTIVANDEGKTEDEAVANLRTELQAQGYADTTSNSASGQSISVTTQIAVSLPAIAPVL